MVDDCFKLLRNFFRFNGKLIVDHVKRNHYDPWNLGGDEDICSFCGKPNELTKEHVLPKWSFQNDPNRLLETIINGSTQTFNKTVIPVCSSCNNDTLGKIEKHIHDLFKNIDLNTGYYEYEESLNVIRWLEIIDYKFHILNFRRKYLRNQSEEFIPYIKNVPMSVMRLNIDLSPYKALSQLRKSQARIARKEKDSRYFSLVFWKTKNKHPLFFHTMNEYIFFEFPEYEMALFYFFSKKFESNYDAEKEAKQLVMKNYG